VRTWPLASTREMEGRLPVGPVGVGRGVGRFSSTSVGDGVSRTKGGVASRSSSTSDGRGVEAAELSEEI